MIQGGEKVEIIQNKICMNGKMFEDPMGYYETLGTERRTAYE